MNESIGPIARGRLRRCSESWGESELERFSKSEEENPQMTENFSASFTMP
jgi:hypothetical protein